ncbi:MAG: YggT family protein [Sphaerochaetaceae bacterium]|nr:YggT family protein [Sphaerochaetaceae bacterium]
MRELARVVSFLLSIYNIMILVRIITSWIQPVRPVKNSSVLDIIARFTDPFLNIFRRVRFLRFQRFDFSVLLALMSISIVQNIISTYSVTGKMSVGYILATIVQSLWWSFFSIFLGIIIILLIIRLVLTYKRTPNTVQYTMLLNQWLQKVLDLVHTSIFSGKAVSDRTLLYTATILGVLLYIALMNLIQIAVRYLVQLPF